MELEVNVEEFPGCCRFNVAHTFPTDNEVKGLLEGELDEIRFAKENGLDYEAQSLEDAVMTIINEDGANLITLNSQQTKVAEIITKHGFVPVLTVLSGHERGGKVTMFVKGATLIKPTTKAAKKKVAKKRTRK